MYDRWLRLLRAFDLTSGNAPSFSKFVCLAILVASIAQRNLTLGIVVALLSASFGRSMWTAFLVRWKGESTDVSIRERRDAERGIEPA